MSNRHSGITAFLRQHGWSDGERQKIAGDASGRRYDRLRRQTDEEFGSIVLLDSEGDTSLPAFVCVAALLRSLDLSAPEVLAHDLDRNLALVEDFGDDSFERLLNAGAAVEPLYDLAVDVLIHLHRRFDIVAAEASALPLYNVDVFLTQLMLFADVCLPAICGQKGAPKAGQEFHDAWAAVLPRACEVPCSLLLRDYHVGNLLHLRAREGIRACGIIDFQDAGVGPVSYDLVSLLEDARREVALQIRMRAKRRYLTAFPEIDAVAFERSCSILAVMRHFRVVAIFVRLASSLGRGDYLRHLPHIWRMIDAHLPAPELEPVARWCAQWLPEKARTILSAQ